MLDLTPGREPSRSTATAASYAGALLMVAVATGVGVLADAWLSVPNVSLVFVLPVVIAAVSFGWGPALAAALAGVAAYNFFLIEPRQTFQVTDPANVWALALLLVVAAIVSGLAARARRQALAALEHARRARGLEGLAQALAAAVDRDAILRATADALSELFGAPAAVVTTGTQRSVTPSPPSTRLGEADMEAAALALASRRPVRSDASLVDGAAFDFWPVVTPSRQQAAIGLAAKEAAERPSEELIELVRGYLAVALDRDAHARDAAEARLDAASERLKAELLAAVSHDLRTPLSTILITLQSLQRFPDSHDAAAREELVGLAETETRRLAGIVGDLLDMSRIEAGAVPVKPEPVSLALLSSAAVDRADGALAACKVVQEVSADLPLVRADPALTETALCNVLENAAKYAPAGSTIVLRARLEDAEAVLEVLDEGPGFPEGAEALFEKFARGVQGDGRPPGAGLGLAIARGFLEAQGASIDAQNRSDRSGGRVRMHLPLAAEAG